MLLSVESLLTTLQHWSNWLMQLWFSIEHSRFGSWKMAGMEVLQSFKYILLHLQWSPAALTYTHTLSRCAHIAHTLSPSFRHHYTHADAHKQLAANYSLFNYFACCPLWWLPWPFPPERLLHSASASPPSWRLLAPMFQTRSQKAGPRNRPSERLRPIKSILPST